MFTFLLYLAKDSLHIYLSENKRKVKEVICKVTKKWDFIISFPFKFLQGCRWEFSGEKEEPGPYYNVSTPYVSLFGVWCTSEAMK